MSENNGILCSIKRGQDEFLALETKTTKLRRVTTDDGGINRLPDDVLYCVFLILQWEDLINVGLVSRRWECLCGRVCSSLRVLDYNWGTVFPVPQAHCSSPLLECLSNTASSSSSSNSSSSIGPFYCPDFEDRFFTCAARSIHNHGANSCISSFKFEFCLRKCSTASTALLDHWVTCALSKGATELDLKYMCRYNCIASKFINLGRTPCGLSKVDQVANLISLSLSWCILPEVIVHQMPCLKSLKLVCVKLGQDVLKSFLSGCRNLETIHLENSDVPKTLFIPDSLTQLKYLRINAPSRWMEFLISSPNLHTYSYRGGSIILSFRNVSCLKEMSFELLQPTKEDMRYLFGRVAIENAMLESLALLFQSYNKQVTRMPERFTKFNQLKRLEIYGYMDLTLNVQNIINILDACPLLEKFILVTISLKEDETNVHPESFYKNLKEVFISRIAFTENYLKLATLLLEHCNALEKMVLGLKQLVHKTGYRIPSKKADRSRSSYIKFRKKLLAHHRSSVVSFTS